MQLYDSIFSRKSTRKFQTEALPAEQLTQIHNFIKTLKPLFPQIHTNIELTGPYDVKGMLAAKAPHYLLLYSEKMDGYLLNAGFLIQQVDLFLSSAGLGSCWLGMAKAAAPTKNDMEYVIMLAFGKAQDSTRREGVSAFKRRELSEIASGFDNRLEAVRLAPSSTNSQPWYFVCKKDCIHVYRKQLGILKAAMYNTMNQIDMGIALCHLYLASEKQGLSFSFSTETEKSPVVDGYQCIGSVE